MPFLDETPVEIKGGKFIDDEPLSGRFLDEGSYKPGAYKGEPQRDSQTVELRNNIIPPPLKYQEEITDATKLKGLKAVPVADSGDTLTPLTDEAFNRRKEAGEKPSVAAHLMGSTAKFAGAVGGDILNIPAAVAGYTKPLENLSSGSDVTEPLPIEKRKSDNPVVQTAGKVGMGLIKMAPLMAVGGAPAWMQKLMAGYFTADMIQNSGESSRMLGEEMGKPPEERDMDKITTAVADLATEAVFAPMAGKHAALDTVESTVAPKTFVVRKLAEQLKNEPLALPPEPGTPLVPYSIRDTDKVEALEAKKAQAIEAAEATGTLPKTVEALKASPVVLPGAAKPEAVKETPAESKPVVEPVAAEETVSETIPVEPETGPPVSETTSATAQGVDVPIGARKSMTAELRDAVGLGVLPDNAGYTLPEIWDEVTQARTVNPAEPAQLSQSVIANPRMLEPVEVGLLTARLLELKKDMNRLADKDDFQGVGTALKEIDALTGAMKLSLGKSSKSLNAGRLIIKDDFSLARLLMDEQVGLNRKFDPNDPKDVERIKEIEATAKAIEEAQKESDKASAIAEEDSRTQAAERAVSELSGEVKAEKLRQARFKGSEFDQGKRGADVLDEIEKVTKKIDPKLIKEANPNWKPDKAIKNLFQEGGMAADEAIEGLKLSGMKPDAFGEALNEAARKRKGDRAARRSDERLMKQEEKEALIESKIASLQAVIAAEHAKISGKPITFGGGAGFEAAFKEIPTLISWVKIGASHANILKLKGIKGFTNWKNEMQANYDLKGTGLDKHLQAVYRASVKEALKQSRELKKGTLDLSPAERRANTLKQARETAAEEDFDKNIDLGRYAKQLAKHYISEGVTKMQEVVEAVHQDLQSIVPDLTRADTMDAISDYGKVRALDNNAVNKRARQLRTEIQMTRKLSDALAGEMPKKTGQQREPSTVLTRQLQKQLKDVMAEQGMNQKDPAKQLASALDAKKNAIRNRIAEIKDELATGKRLVRTDKGEIKLDAEGEALQTELDTLKKQREDIFGKDAKKPLTDEQKLQRATDAAEKDLQKWTQRALDAAEGKGEYAKPSKSKDTSKEIEAIKAQTEAAKAEYEELSGLKSRLESEKAEKALQTKVEALEKDIAKREAELSTGNFETKGQQANRPQEEPIEKLLQRRRELVEQKAAAKKITNQATPEAKEAQARAKELESLEKQIAERQAKIAAGDLSTKPKAVDRPSATAELEQARQQLKAVNEQLADMRKQAKASGKPSVEEMYVKRRLTALTRAEADYQSRIAKGDFESPRPKKAAPSLNPAQRTQIETARARVEKMKSDWMKRVEDQRLANRTKTEKVADGIVAFTRAAILSSLSIFEKLGMAAVWRVGTTIGDAAVGEIINKLPGISKVADKATFEGHMSPQALLAAIHSTRQGLLDAFQTTRTGTSDLTHAYGEVRTRIPGVYYEIMETPGRLHATIKAPIKRAIFEMSYVNAMLANEARGVDTSDPAVQLRISKEAYVEANRAIFQQSNALVKRMEKFEMPQIDPETGKEKLGSVALRTASRIALPIRTTPMNILAETFNYLGGTVVGGVKLSKALSKGAEHLSEAQADQIMRHLKKGLLGNALLLMGYYMAGQVAGLYRQRKDDKKAGDIEVPSGGVMVPIGHNLLHSPAITVLNVGATLRQVAEEKIANTQGQEGGLDDAAFVASIGLLSETPGWREMVGVGRLQERGGKKVMQDLIRDRVVPQVIQWEAKREDKDANGNPIKRNPRTLQENIWTGIPGMRPVVPAK